MKTYAFHIQVLRRRGDVHLLVPVGFREYKHLLPNAGQGRAGQSASSQLPHEQLRPLRTRGSCASFQG